MNPTELDFQNRVLVGNLASTLNKNKLLGEELKSIRTAYGELSAECADLRFRLSQYEKVEIKFKPPQAGDIITIPTGHRLQGQQGKILKALVEDEAILVEVDGEATVLKWNFDAVQPS